jgi:biotin transport system substrate-specific component
MAQLQPSFGEAIIDRQQSWIRSWLLACMMTGVTVLSARFAEYIPPTPIPVTLQVFAVLLTGLLLGRRWGSVAQLQYLALGLVGAPVFAKAGHGSATLFGLTGGYLLSYPIAAYTAGCIAETSGAEKSDILRQLLACASAIAIIYGMGCAWYAAYAHLPLYAVVLPGAMIFLFWDCVKACAAIGVARGIRARWPSLGR